MKEILIILLYFIFWYTGFSQNLIPNSSFELYHQCPNDLNGNYKSDIIINWYSPTKGTPDYFNSCSQFNVSVPINVMGSMYAFEGNGYVGLILLEKPDINKFGRKRPYNYREYIQCKLAEPLLKDSLYQVKYSYCISPFSTYIVQRPEVVFSTKPLKSRTHVNIEVQITPFYDSLSVENKPGEWYEVCTVIRGNENEHFLTIGNFQNDKNTIYKPNDLTQVPTTRITRILEDCIAYYFIDNIEVIQINSTKGKSLLNKINY
jgi:OOP family OmpA-OmpF porin